MLQQAEGLNSSIRLELLSSDTERRHLRETVSNQEREIQQVRHGWAGDGSKVHLHRAVESRSSEWCGFNINVHLAGSQARAGPAGLRSPSVIAGSRDVPVRGGTAQHAGGEGCSPLGCCLCQGAVCQTGLWQRAHCSSAHLQEHGSREGEAAVVSQQGEDWVIYWVIGLLFLKSARPGHRRAGGCSVRGGGA